MPTRLRRKVALLSLVIVVAWAICAASVLVLALLEARSGQTKLKGLRDAFSSPSGLDSFAEVLNGSRTDFFRATSLLGSPLLAPVRLVPILSRQLDSFDAITRAAERVAEIGAEAVDELPALTDPQSTRPEGRLVLSQRVSRIAAAAHRRLDNVDLGPRPWLVSPLARLREQFAADLDGLRRASQIAVDLNRFLEGPRSYLVLAANNAEMRVGSGMFLSAGLLSVEDGRFDLGPMDPTAFMRVPNGKVRLTGDFQKLWGSLNPNREWRNLGLTPRFDVVGRLASRMWKALDRGDVDGVLAVDAVALRALLRATGSVSADGQTIGPKNVMDQVLHDQYVDVSHAPDAQRARRDRISELASAAMSALDRGGWEPYSLVYEIGKAAQGRHILGWAADSREQRMWQAAGTAGMVGPRSLLVGLANRGGNKLDQFVRVGAHLAVTHGLGVTAGTLGLTIRNQTPGGEPQYIAGPHPLSNTRSGEYIGILTITLPQTVSKARIDGVERLAVAGPDGSTTVMGTMIKLRRGESRRMVARFELPGDEDQLVVLPSARVPPITWQFGDATWQDNASREVSYGRLPISASDAAIVLTVVLALIAGVAVIVRTRRPQTRRDERRHAHAGAVN